MPSPQLCPCCSSPNTATIESRPIRQSARRRRRACHACGYRWTDYTDAQGRLIAAPPQVKPKPPRPRQRRLDPDQVHLILTSPGRPLVNLAAELGVSRETVRHVRHGISYSDVHPRLPRQPKRSRLAAVMADGPSCLLCSHWRGECRMGFPDPELEGPGFATDCSLYAAA
jgi:hypothetical protein